MFKANDAPSMGWHNPQGSHATRPKGKGKGIMISDFVEEYGGFLALTDDELRKGWFSNTSFTTGLKTLPTF